MKPKMHIRITVNGAKFYVRSYLFGFIPVIKKYKSMEDALKVRAAQELKTYKKDIIL